MRRRSLVWVLGGLLVIWLAGSCGPDRTDIEGEEPAVEETGEEELPGLEGLEEEPEPGFGTEPGIGVEDVEEEEPVELDDVFFAFDKYDLSEDSKSILAENAEELKESPETRITIEGHCDERGTVAYNLALGEKRARAAMQYLVGFGISPSRIEIISYGKERPFALGHNEEAWSQNRRAHFVIAEK
jgi:peptidoglycan-associated lipoprotein